MTFRAACIQFCSSPRMDDNLRRVEALVKEAADKGARLIVLPENIACMAASKEAKLAAAMPEENHPALAVFSALSAQTGAVLVAGSLSVAAGNGKMFNRSLVFESGSVAARYDKIHLYDAAPGDGEVYRESDLIVPGARAVVVHTSLACLGLSICYDMRFPELYRQLALAGAEVITVPAAFTVPTGQAHWHVLLRARAIETGCYVLAAAQGGEHEGGRRTWGHSLIVSPWGEILAEKNDDAPGILFADLDPGKVAQARNKIASLKHARGFSVSR